MTVPETGVLGQVHCAHHIAETGRPIPLQNRSRGRVGRILLLSHFVAGHPSRLGAEISM